MAQVQAMHAWARENNVDPSQVPQLLQSARIAAMAKQNEAGAASHQSFLPQLKQQLVSSSPAGSENSAHVSSSSDMSGQAGPAKSRAGPIPQQQLKHQLPHHQQRQQAAYNRENTNEKVARHSGSTGMHLPQSSGGQNLVQSDAKMGYAKAESMQTQHFKPSQQSTQPVSQPASNHIPSQGGVAQMPQERTGFTKHQLHVLKAQILAFRRIKRGERVLPEEVLQAIAPPPLDLQQPSHSSGMANPEKSDRNNTDENTRHAEASDSTPQVDPSRIGFDIPKDETFRREDRAPTDALLQGRLASRKEPVNMEIVGKFEQNGADAVKSEPDVEKGSRNLPNKVQFSGDEGNTVPVHSASIDAGQVKKPVSTGSTTSSKDSTARKYHGPLFDFPSFTRKHDSLGSANANYSSNLTLAYDANDLLFEEGISVLSKRRMENSKKISDLLAVNLERKRIRPDLVLRLQIEEKKLRLVELQARLRDEVDNEQQEIMAMPDRPYRKFVRECERQRTELIRQVQHSEKLLRDKQLKSILQWRKKFMESNWAIRDARITRNRGVAKYQDEGVKFLRVQGRNSLLGNYLFYMFP